MKATRTLRLSLLSHKPPVACRMSRQTTGAFFIPCRGSHLVLKLELHPAREKTAKQLAGDVDEGILGFLRALQEGDDIA